MDSGATLIADARNQRSTPGGPMHVTRRTQLLDDDRTTCAQLINHGSSSSHGVHVCHMQTSVAHRYSCTLLQIIHDGNCHGQPRKPLVYMYVYISLNFLATSVFANS